MRLARISPVFRLPSSIFSSSILMDWVGIVGCVIVRPMAWPIMSEFRFVLYGVW